MHETYRSFAVQIACDRMREAARWRLADEAHRGRAATGIVSRIRRRLIGVGRQPLVVAFRAEPSDCR
jgi:hypothetical protein